MNYRPLKKVTESVAETVCSKSKYIRGVSSRVFKSVSQNIFNLGEKSVQKKDLSVAASVTRKHKFISRSWETCGKKLRDEQYAPDECIP